VLEIGTKRSNPATPTIHRDLVPHGRWVGLDIELGLDVDLVADAHQLPFAPEAFQVVIGCSLLEHLKRPWVAMGEMCRVVGHGGVLFVDTHQTFPLHAYGKDFWRFTIESLMSLLPEGWLVMSAAYEFPTQIVSDREPTSRFPAYLNVGMTAYRQ
jgi:SAM-dependent methyltransferase